MHAKQNISYAVCLLAPLLMTLCGCGAVDAYDVSMQVGGGDPDRGRHLMFAYGCGSCHMIPGVAQANGTVGPPLHSFRRRSYVAGILPNTPENLTLWISAPQDIDPATAMPNLGVTREQARHMAAHLYTLR